MNEHVSDLFDHVHALARVIHPIHTIDGHSWWLWLLQKYHLPIPEDDPRDLTVSQLYTLWIGLIDTETSRFNSENARGEHDLSVSGSLSR